MGPALRSATYAGRVLRFVLVVLVFAWATYLLVRALQNRGLTPPSTPSRRPGLPRRPQAPRVVAPDDDEDFLRELDRRRLHPDDGDQTS